MTKTKIYHLDASDFEKQLILENKEFNSVFLDTPFDFDGDLEKFLKNILQNGNAEEANLKNIEVLTVFITHKINQKVLDLLPNLKLVCTRSTGTDHIDLEACKARDVEVKNVVGYGAGSVAEHTFALILNISHYILALNERTQNLDMKYLDLLGFDLENKTLGVVGACGAIGKKVVQIASGFGMKILANDFKPDLEMEKQYDLKFVDVNEIIKKSDIITLHVPLLDSTKNLLNKENLINAKKNLVLINTARGGIISNETLLWAIENGVFVGAGVDALENENLLKELKDLHNCLDENEVKESCRNVTEFEKKETLIKIIKNPKILFTPHSAYYTEGSLRKIVNGTFENIDGFIE